MSGVLACKNSSGKRGPFRGVGVLVLLAFSVSCTTPKIPLSSWKADQQRTDVLSAVSIGSEVTVLTQDGKQIHGRVVELHPDAVNVDGRWIDAAEIEELIVFDDSFSANDKVVLAVTILGVAVLVSVIWLYLQASSRFGI